MLDVNAGIPLVDEAELLKAMIRPVQDAVDVPLCIDSSVIEALEAGLSVYEGKALVNSVTGEDDRLEEILPLVARTARRSWAWPTTRPASPRRPSSGWIARKIVSAAGDHGIPPEDVVIDPLAMTVGAANDAVLVTLETISLIRDELGVNMSLGASNVSFGLPERPVLNGAFLAMASAAGLTSAIMNPIAPGCVPPCAPATCCSARTPGARAGSRASAPGRPRRRRIARAPGARASSTSRPPRTASGCASCSATRTARAGGPRPRRHHAVRRRLLERRRDRLHLRRTRHLQEVQGQGHLGRAPISPGRSAGVLDRGAQGRLAAGLPGPPPRRT